MKLIYYCDFLESYATNLAIAVAAESNEVALILRDIPVLRERRADEALLEGRPANLGVDAQELAGGYSSIKSVVAVCKMYRQKRQAGYDVFHVQQTGDPRFLWLAMRMRTVLTLHEPCPRDGVTSGVGRWLNWLIRQLNACTDVSLTSLWFTPKAVSRASALGSRGRLL